MYRFIIWTLSSIPLTCRSVFALVPHCLDYCRLVVSFEIRNSSFSNISAILGPLHFCVNFRISLFNIIEQSLHSWDKPYLIMMYYPFYIFKFLLNIGLQSIKGFKLKIDRNSFSFRKFSLPLGIKERQHKTLGDPQGA